MKKLATAIAAIALFGTPTFAADMATKMPVKAPPPAPVPAYTWTGFYIGGNAGYAWSHASTFPLTGTQGIPPVAGVGILTAQLVGFYPFTSSVGQNGAIGGLQAGYNWQFNWLVTGIEADFDFASVTGSSNFAGSALPLPFFAVSNISRRLDDLGTLP